MFCGSGCGKRNLELLIRVHKLMRFRSDATFMFTALLILLTDRTVSAYVVQIEQPPSLNLEARTENDQTVFHIGELVRLQLSYTASGAGYRASTASYDRGGRLGAEQYLVQPEAGWDDPLRSYFSLGAFMGGGLFSLQPLSTKPYVLYRDLNEWVRFNQPGRYRVVVSSTRASPTTYRLSQVNPELRSNELWITLIPATAEWQAATLANAVAQAVSPGRKILLLRRSHKANRSRSVCYSSERSGFCWRHSGSSAAIATLAPTGFAHKRQPLTLITLEG